ncbi:SCO4225 family membrane protein [Actinoplanes sp. NPDC049118]|uniref:SCO4225 family membrane protein n=1 Tax=Actinoplanes sp. NPDC049118 TaxID=3155769 RepID=UPI0033DB0F17
MTQFFFGNWATRGYLFAVAVAAAVLIGGNLATGNHEPTTAAIYLIGLTAPVSVIFAPFFLLGDGWLAVAMLWLSVAAGALLNTLLINTIAGQAGRLRSHRA